MKIIILILLLASCKPEKRETAMTKTELIDAIASGSKLTKADAG